MATQIKFLKFLGAGLSLVLLLTPLHGISGQAMTEEDGEVGEVVESDGVVDLGTPEAAREVLVVSEATTSANADTQAHRIFLPTIQGTSEGSGQVVAAFAQTWAAENCVNVLNVAQDRGLWDDMPGPGGANNEAGLLWFKTDSGADEQCSYRSVIAGAGVVVNSLRFRAAVNDNARFQVGIYRLDAGGACVNHANLRTPAVNDDSVFRTYTLNLAAAVNVCRVQILLTDDPDALIVNTNRTTTLIDFISLLNGGVQTWGETFSN